MKRTVRVPVPALTATLPRGARFGVNALGALLALAVFGLLLADIGAFGSGAAKGFFNDWIYNAAELAAASLVLARALLVRAERPAWLVLALGVLFYAAADIYYTLALEPMANIPTPSLSDVGYLGFYVCAYVMIVLLARSHVRNFHASVWLDGAIGALSVSAVGAALVLEPVTHTTHGTFAAVATNLAYPLGDLLLLAFVVGVFALTGWRPGRTWTLIGAGFALLGVADSIYLFRVAENTYAAGTVLDAMWPAGLLLLALAAWCMPRRHHEIRFEGLAVMVSPCVFALAATALLIRGNYVHQEAFTEALATAALVVAGARFALSFNDVRRLSDVRERQARTDELTGLSNRRHFYALLDAAIDGCRQRGGTFALLMLDLDNFKELNDTLGHYAGDLVLAQIGPRMQAVLRGGATARLGGDEFGLIVRDADGAEAAAERILQALARPFELEGASVSVQASVGIASFPRDALDMTRLLRCADVAMYEAKETHARVAFYSPEGDEPGPPRLGLLSELRAAIGRGELEVHYQPQVDLQTLEPSGAEALVRWRDSSGDLIGPDSFIAMAEQGGAMRELTSYVLREALAQHRRWREAGHDLAIAVNVSATNLLDTAFLGELRAALDCWHTPPSSLRLEITESVLISEGPRVRSVLDALSRLGVQLSLDDFGTGYSPLAYLRDLPVDEIKIDRSFVSAMTEEAETETIVESTIALARRLGMNVVAEGIETRAQLVLLRSLECPFGQGFLFSQPLPAAELERWLQSGPAMCEAAAEPLGELAGEAVELR